MDDPFGPPPPRNPADDDPFGPPPPSKPANDDPFGPPPPPRPAPAANDDPFGPPIPLGRPRSSAEPQEWAEKAKNLFDSHPKFRAEKPKANNNGILMQVIHEKGNSESQRYMVKAAYPGVAAFLQNEIGYMNVSSLKTELLHLVPCFS